MLALDGRLQLRDWTDSDGHKRRNAEVMVDNVFFTGSKTESRSEAADDVELDEVDEEDLPF